MKEWNRRPRRQKVLIGKHILLFWQKLLLLSFLCLARRFLSLFYYDFITFYCIRSKFYYEIYYLMPQYKTPFGFSLERE